MRVSSIIKSDKAITTKQGKAVIQKVLERLVEGKRVTLDFGDLIVVSKKFLKPITDCIVSCQTVTIKDNLRFYNVGKFNQRLVGMCFKDSLCRLKTVSYRL